jgi:hypothetical protein
MLMEQTFRDLSSSLRTLCERVQELGITVNQDRPKSADAAVVDDFEYAVDDLLGWLNEALAAAAEAHGAVGRDVDLNRARRALAVCQEKFRRIENVFSASLFSDDRRKALTRFGRERRGEWPSWAATVRLGIEHCRKPVDEVRNRIFECLNDIADRAGGTSVSISNIAQQNTSPAGAAGTGKG